MTLLTMIDYGIGNYRSVQKALEAVGAAVVLTDDVEAIAGAAKLVLPGVGAFGATMDALTARGQDAALRAAVARGTPLLGICVGMQVLFDDSDELGFHTGLGLIPGRVRRFPDGHGYKIPHMGWNQLQHDGRSPLLADVKAGDYAYFVHSYYCAPADSADTLATTDYAVRCAAIVGRGAVYGIQFHAEKSQHVGLRILRNFVTL